MLAPFLDRLITRDVSKRFTAEQALQFLEDEVLPNTTEEQMAVKERPEDTCHTLTYEYYDRWEGLSEEFQRRWAAYREPLGVPVTSRILRYLRNIEWLPLMLMPKTRLILFRLTHVVPRLLWTQFTNLAGYPSVYFK